MITANGDPLFIDRLKDIQRCITYLPGETWKIMDPVYYCRSCRAILARVATTDYEVSRYGCDFYTDLSRSGKTIENLEKFCILAENDIPAALLPIFVDHPRINEN